MHVIVGDSNMCEATTALKVGSTELLLDALDLGVQVADLALEDPLKAIRDLNWDLTGQLLLAMKGGSFKRAVDIQATILARVEAAIDKDKVSKLQLYVLDLWRRTIDAVATNDWSAIDTEIDFAIKKKVLNSYTKRSGAGLGDVRVARLMLDYHDVTGGLRQKLEASGLMRRLSDPDLVKKASKIPPQTTRAALRGKVIAIAEANRRDLNADWVHLRLEGQSNFTVSLQDPFATSDERVSRLIELIESDKPNLPA